MTIQLTQKAINKLKTELAKENKSFVRLGVKSGGCNGFTHVIEYTDTKKNKDSLYEFDGLKVVVDPKSINYLKDITVDYESRNLLELGFKFRNNLADKTCGCGTSFSLKDNKQP